MSKILTSNVVISKYKESLENLFRSDVIDFKSIDDTKFLVSPKKNKYLISLEYEINYNSKTHASLNLVFADIDGNFEEEYLSPSKDTLNKIIEKSIDSKNWQNINAGTLRNVCRDSIYVSFGVGDSSRNWSPPSIFELYNAFVEIEDGFRYYKLSYIPINNPLFTKDLLLDSSEVNPQKEKIPLINVSHLLELKVEVNDDDSFSKILEKFYKEYLSRLCSTNNVVILIPEGIDEFIKSKADTRQKQINLFSEYFFIDLIKPQNHEPDPVVTPPSPPNNSSPNTNVTRIEFDDPKRGRSKSLGEYLVATFNLTKINSNTQFNILDINIFEPVNSLSFGIQTCLKISDSVSVRAENSLNILNIFKQFGLIKNVDSGRCIILGVDKQIDELVYQNHFDINNSTEPVLKLFNDSEVKNILENNSYQSSIRSIARKKKHSSGFEESINLDELTIDARAQGQNRSKVIDPVVDSLLKVIKKYEDTDMPVFTHNLKNSNVLNINLENKNNTYLNALNFAVEEDFYNKLIEETKSESGLKNSEAYEFIENNAERIIRTVTEVINLISEENLSSKDPTYPRLYDPEGPAQKIYDHMLLNNQNFKNINVILINTIAYLFSDGDWEDAKTKLFKTPTGDTFNKIIQNAYTILTLLEQKKYLISLQSLAGRDTSDFRKAAIFQRLYNIGSPSIKIKTLPYFHLSDYKTIASKWSILLSKKALARISPNQKSLNDLVNYLDFYSGVYCIVGFKHTINPNGAYSEFRLVKRYLETI